MAQSKKEKLYSVSYISFFNNEMKTAFVISEKGPMDALLKGLQELVGKEDAEAASAFEEECSTVEEAKQFAFDCDSMVDVRQYRKSEAVH